MKEETGAPLLNTAQRRSLELTLRRMEELVEQSRLLRLCAQEGDTYGILTAHHFHLSQQQCETLAALEDAARRSLRGLADALNLTQEIKDVRHQLYAQFTLLWADLLDERPESLTHWGALHPDAVPILEPAIAELADLSKMFAAALEHEEP